MSSLRAEDDPAVRQRPTKRATIAMEEGETDSSLDKLETGISSGGSGSGAGDDEKERGVTGDNALNDGLVGSATGPARRTGTANTDPAEGRSLAR